MTPTHFWHVTSDELRDYAADASQPLLAASIEAHLLACEECRTTLAAERQSAESKIQGASRTEQLWARIADRVDIPRRPSLSSSRALQVSLASPPLVAATAGTAMALLVTVGVVAVTYPHWLLPVQLALAPLAPATAALIAFQPGTDPAGRLVEATPLAGTRLPMLRALFASLLSLGAGLVASVLSNAPFDVVALWLLPGLGFAAIVLASATLFNPIRVAGAVIIGWSALVFSWTQQYRAAPTTEDFPNLISNQRGLGWILIGSTLAAIVVSYRRRDATPTWRV